MQRTKRQTKNLRFLIGLIIVSSFPITTWAQYGKVYCSSSEGSDDNDGLTPKTAVRTIANAAGKGRHILLKGGDTFYERIPILGSEEYPYVVEGYGKGMPIISGFKVAAKGKGLWLRGVWDKSGEWQASEQGDIWRIDLWSADLEGFVGQSQWCCDVGCVYLPATDEIHGICCGFRTADVETVWLPNRQFSRNMKDDYDYFQPWGQTEDGSLKMPDDRYFYMKLSTDPNQQEIWLSSGEAGVSCTFTTIDGLKIWGWGTHGVGTGTNTNVRNCVIDVIGGSLFIGYSAGTRYGNGIEFYVGRTQRDCLCEHNTISRTFDCGVTIQGAGYPGATAENIVFRHNIIKDCRQSCEFWLANAVSKDNPALLDMKNCSFDHNVCYPTHSNYGMYLANNSQILYYQGESDIKGLTIADNTFIGGDTYYFNSGSSTVAEYHGNRYICLPGSMLNRKAWRLPVEADKVKRGDEDWTEQRDGMYRYQTSNTEYAYASTLKEANRQTVACFSKMIGDPDLKVIVRKRLPKCRK